MTGDVQRAPWNRSRRGWQRLVRGRQGARDRTSHAGGRDHDVHRADGRPDGEDLRRPGRRALVSLGARTCRSNLDDGDLRRRRLSRTGFPNAGDLAWDSDGSLWLNEEGGNAIVRVAADSTTTRFEIPGVDRQRSSRPRPRRSRKDLVFGSFFSAASIPTTSRCSVS